MPGLRCLAYRSRMDAMTGTLELRQVFRVYGQGAAEVHTLHGVSLDVAPGTMVAVMGPSGSGKSTLLTIAGSLEEPTSGQVLVAGQDLAAMSRDDKARLRRQSVGYVFQDFNPLDSANAEAVMRMIHTACERGVAAVVVTHDAKLASWADRVVLIRDGRVVDQATPAPSPEPEPLPGRDR
jgi:ABC-type lipoprotein export system ATPase subunit